MELSELQQRVLNKLNETPDADVDITVLYASAYPGGRLNPSSKRYRYQTSVRDLQMKLGTVISRINEKIADKGWRVCPGERKQTYRLVTKAD